MMQTKITACFPAQNISSYSILIQSQILQNPLFWVPKTQSKIVIITDHQVKKLYANLLEQALKNEGYKTLLISCFAGEQSKNIQMKCYLETEMLKNNCDKDTLILALGGGVVGDLAGFVAATYMRGIAYIQIPTTLLAMLDSSIGGKTGINTPYGKNLIGSFWHPISVIADISCLQTLAKEQIINGLIEAFKMFLTSDFDSLNFCQQNLDLILNKDENLLNLLVHRALQVKLKIIQNDVWEKQQRTILNFGHTIGHALEKITNYQILHGYAVAYGILIEAKIAQLMGLILTEDYNFIKNFLQRLEINANKLKVFKVDELINNTLQDKKNFAGKVNYILLNKLGAVYQLNNQFVHSISEQMVKKAFFATIED